MPAVSSRGRPMWQFSLRTMLIAVTAIAAWFGLLVSYPFAAVIVLLVALMMLSTPNRDEFNER